MVKNLCNLIIAVGFNFCANLTVRSSLNCWDQFITVGSSQDFKSNRFFLLIFPSNDYRFPISCLTSPISDISANISNIFIPGRTIQFATKFSSFEIV